MNTDMNEVIDNSLAVASLTGSTCLEAVIRSKPGIIFGYPWYEGANIFTQQPHEECKSFGKYKKSSSRGRYKKFF